ncbi:amine sulfotransferase-like [Mercenaria mercenaria]|uniref:amine sulfotransferase-like n=1 Tax=Mercenaria mercenaria TaxID=6596 RepID=UPI00234F4256|nr:amine sulfotransferase-like [Mercenaria mercenaria]
MKKNGKVELEKLKMKPRVYKGILMPDNEVEVIENMNTREDDIWVCSYPRSGTTLTQQIVSLVMTLDFKAATTVQLNERFPQVDITDERYPYFKGVKYIEQLPSPRMVKCHLHHFLLPEQLRNGKGRIIYIARNPKDVVVSWYHLLEWTDELLDDLDTWDKFLDSFVDGTGIFCPWPRHVTEYWERRDDKNVLFLKYENVTKDISKAVKDIACFLNREITDEDVDRISKFCHVDNMRKNDMANLSYWRDFKKVNDNAGGRFINKGKSGVWKEFLSHEEATKNDGLLEQVKQSGLTFED